MKEKESVEQCLNDARKFLANGDYLNCCAAIVTASEMIPGAPNMEKETAAIIKCLKRTADVMGGERFNNGSLDSILCDEANDASNSRFEEILHHPETPEDRSLVLHSIQTHIANSLCTLELLHRCSKPGIFQEMKKIAEQMDEKDFKKTLESYLSEEAMLYLEPDQDSEKLKQRKKALHEKWNKTRQIIFYAIVTSGPWDTDTYSLYKDLILSPTVDSVTSQMLVSALTLACSTIFSFNKFDLLRSIYTYAKDEEVQQRALVGMLLASTRMPKGVREYRYTTCGAWGPQDYMAFLNVQKQLALTIASERKSKDFASHFMDNISDKMLGALKHSIMEHGDDTLKDLLADEDLEAVNSEDVESTEIEMMDEGRNFSIKMNEDVDARSMLDKGTDILLSQFENACDYPFFKEVSNWFLPYDENHPLLADAVTAAKKKELAGMLEIAASSCAADAYALALLTLKSPDDVPDFASDEEDEYDEEDETEYGEDEAEYGEDEAENDGNENGAAEEDLLSRDEREYKIRTRYLRNLIRFYKFADMRDEFFNLFDDGEKGTPGYAVLASPMLQDHAFDKYRLAAARFSTRLEVQSVVEALLRNIKANDLETHYMKGWAYLNREDVTAEAVRYAVDHFNAMLKIQPGMKKAYNMLLECYTLLGADDLYLECFDQLWKQSDSFSEERKLELKKQKFDVLFDAWRFEEAIELGYELEYLQPDNLMVSAKLSYCLMRREGEHAAESMQKAKERIEAYFVEEDRLEKMMKDAENSKNLKQMFATTMGLFLKLLKKDKEAEAINGYTLSMIYMVEGRMGDAMDRMFKARTCHKSEGEGMHDILVDNREWLTKHGVSWEDVVLMYNYLDMEVHELRYSMQKMLDEKRKKGK